MSKSSNKLMRAIGMPHDVTFKFSPMQYVRIKHFGLGYEGRIVRCIFESCGNIYDVDYAVNGELRRREFYEDELEARK